MSTTIPNLNSPRINHADLAKTTRKVMDRIAPFCYMTEPSLERVNSTSTNASPSPTVPSTAFSSPAISPSPSLSGLSAFEESKIVTRSATLPPQAQAKLVGRIRTRVIVVVGTIDSHIQAAQVAFKMCREGMVLCDEDVRGPALNPEDAKQKDAAAASGQSVAGAQVAAKNAGSLAPLKSKHKHKKARAGKEEENATGGNDGWEVDIDPDEADDRGIAIPVDDDHKYGSSGHHFLLHHAHQGLDLARKTEECFKEIQQEIYKIAAQTKDQNASVLVPSGPGQPPTVRKHLKDVGLDLVSNLSLLDSDFGRKIKDTMAWWRWVIEDLEKGQESALCPVSLSQPSSSDGHDGWSAVAQDASKDENKEAMKRAYKWWEEEKNGWQAYYDIIAGLHIAYHDLLLASARAWDGTAVVVKHSESNEHLEATGNKTSEAGYEVLEAQSVSRSLSGTGAQDKAARTSKSRGFLMWKAPYAKSPNAEVKKEKSTALGKARRWTSWRGIGRRNSNLGAVAVQTPANGENQEALGTEGNAAGTATEGGESTAANNSRPVVRDRSPSILQESLGHLGFY